jgi:hypothetical protein
LPPNLAVQAFGYFPQNVADKYGIIYAGSAITPPGWATGKWNWVQLIKSKRLFDNTTGTHTYMGDGVTFKLDSWYPYKPGPSSGNPAVAGSYPADGSKHDDKDLPNEPTLGRTRVECHEIFETYLMFKPPGSGSRYVTLKKVVWKWGWQRLGRRRMETRHQPGRIC